MEYKILVISAFVPYDKVGHAGGKVHNYYLKKFNKDKQFKIKLITFANLYERDKIDLEKYKVDHKIFYYDEKISTKLKRLLLYNMSKKLNPFDKNGGYLDYHNKTIVIRYLNKLKAEGYYPKVIILTWTEIVLMISEIKDIFPKSKYIAIEHDVSYLSLYRRYLCEENRLIKYLKKVRYENLKKTEVQKLKEFDLVMPLNIKDMKLLANENLVKDTKLDYISAYFQNLSFVKPNFKENNIIFFGAMYRQENYESCIWFIENVFDKLIKLDKSFKFVIVGNKPNEKLYKYANKNIIITGFVDDVTEYFNNALCMVAPLILGAGIKIKILEGMSSGLPVLTNNIGIEGIPASQDDFIYCKSADDYLNNILLLKNDTNKAIEIGNNAKKFITENFNLDKSYEKYKMHILKLID